MSHPVDAVYPNGSPVAKAAVRGYEAARGALVLASDSESLSLNLPTTLVLVLGGQLFRYDDTDVVSAHDGVDVLVSAEGRRYKRTKTLSDLTQALVLLLIGPGGLPIDRIEPGAANTIMATLATLERGWITGSVLADILDAALGSANWRTGVFDIAIGSLVKRLPANATRGMVGGRYRLVQMADDTLRIGGAGTGQVNGDPGGNHIGQMRRVGFPQSFVPHADGKFYAALHAGYAIDADDYPWSWGDGSFGALGHGNTSNIAVPKRIEWFVTNSFKVRECVPIMSGADPVNYGCYFLELGGTGRVAYAGYHGWGAAGDGTAASGSKTTPVLVSGLTNVTYITASCNPTTALARRSDGSWRGWGANDGLCLGIAGASFTSPQVLGAMAGWVKAVCAGRTTLALTDTGAAKTAGENTYGGLGVGNTSTLSGWQDPTGLGSNVVDIFCNQEFACALGVIQTVAGAPTAKFWGFNATGQIGDGTTTQRNAPFAPSAPWQGTVDDIIIAGENGITANVGATFVRCGNHIYAAGYNGSLGLSIGISGNVSSFTEVVGHIGNIVDWAVLGYYGYFGLIVLTDKGCFSGGSNEIGEACLGPSFVNSAILQDLWVTTVMGPAGQNGESFTFDQVGSFAARPSAGSVPNGWNYVANDTVPTATLYTNLSGTWSAGIPVFTGLSGTDGRTILSGSGAPSGATGSDGDYYINTSGYVIYGPKTAGAWGSGTNMIGADGKTILNGTGAPSNGSGSNGDFYIDTASNTLYGPKAAGAWPAGVAMNGVFTGSETIETTIDNADWFYFRRASDNAYRRITRANALSGIGGGGLPRRQTVLAGPVTAAGLPDILPATSVNLNLTTQNLGTTALLVAAAKGFNSSGPIDALGYAASNLTWTGLTANRAAATPNYLFVTVSGGSLTTGFTTLAPILDQNGGTISVTNGQYTFDRASMKMYLGNGSSAAAVDVVFVGEAATNATTVISTVAYAYQGRYVSALVTWPTVSVLYNGNHNLGVKPLNWRLAAVNNTAESGCVPGDEIEAHSLFYTASPNNCVFHGFCDTKMWSAIYGATAGFYGKSGSTFTPANWRMRFVADRGW